MRVSREEAIQRGWIRCEDTPEVPNQSRRSKKSDIEAEEQVVVVDQFRVEYADVGYLLIHIPNGGSRKNRYEGWRLKRQGARKGVSDLLLPVARGGFHMLWIEFKARPPFDAPVTPHQAEWIRLMREQGCQAQVCLGVDAAMACLRTYMAMPPTVVMMPSER